MKASILSHKYTVHPKILYWGKLLTVIGIGQISAQGLGMLTGILIIRLLPTREYAYYTLANTALGMMTMLSDAGISNGVMAKGGKVWQDKTQLGVVLASGLELRKKFAVSSLFISIPVLAFLLLRNGADWLTTILIIAVLVPCFLAVLSDMLLEVGPKLHQQINPLQKNQIEVSLLRLFLSVVCLFIFPFTAVALLINGATRIYGNRKLMKIAYIYADKDSPADAEVKKDILSMVKRVLPPMLYYCFSSQIIVWIPSFLGNTAGVAQIGAISRLAVVLGFFSNIIATLVLPRFARIADSQHKGILRLFVYIQFMLIVMSACIMTIFYAFPSQFLWILGDSYSNLSYEFTLMIMANTIGVLSSLTAQIISSRGWIIHPLITIAINVSSIVASFYLFNLSQIKGVLYYDILLNSLSYIFAIGYGFICLKKLRVNTF